MSGQIAPPSKQRIWASAEIAESSGSYSIVGGDPRIASITKVNTGYLEVNFTEQVPAGAAALLTAYEGEICHGKPNQDYVRVFIETSDGTRVDSNFSIAVVVV